MRALVVILVVATAVGGFLLGRLSAPEVRGRGGERGAPQVVTPAPSDAQRSASEPRPSASEANESPAESEAPRIDVVPPAEASEDLEEDGLLLVDLHGIAGKPVAWIGEIDIAGGFEQHEIEAQEDEVARFEASAGTYDVWWLNQEGLRVGTRARLEAGKVTHVRLADLRTEAPIPRGLGALNLYVEAAEGGGMSVEVRVSDGAAFLDVLTNDAGHGIAVMRPGRYSISVGHHRGEAVVEEGRTTFHRVDHGHEGDLVILAEHPMEILVQSADRDEILSWQGRVGAPGAPTLAPYLAEGEYDVLLEHSFDVPLARIKIHAGGVTRFRCEPPGGRVLVRVVPATEEVELHLCRVGSGKEEFIRASPQRLSEPLMLMPGHYALTVSAAGCEPRSTEFDVADRVVEVTLELPRLR